MYITARVVVPVTISTDIVVTAAKTLHLPAGAVSIVLPLDAPHVYVPVEAVRHILTPQVGAPLLFVPNASLVYVTLAAVVFRAAISACSIVAAAVPAFIAPTSGVRCALALASFLVAVRHICFLNFGARLVCSYSRVCLASLRAGSFVSGSVSSVYRTSVSSVVYLVSCTY